jgi:hypothetical protein
MAKGKLMDEENRIFLKNEELEEINKSLGVPNYFKEAEILYIDHVKKNLKTFVRVLARDNISYSLYERWTSASLIKATQFDPEIRKNVDIFKDIFKCNYQDLKKEVPEITHIDVLSPTTLIKFLHAEFKDIITNNFTEWQKIELLPELTLAAMQRLNGHSTQLGIRKIIELGNKDFIKTFAYNEVNLVTLMKNLFKLKTTDLENLWQNFSTVKEHYNFIGFRDLKRYEHEGIKETILRGCAKENYQKFADMPDEKLLEHLGIKSCISPEDLTKYDLDKDKLRNALDKEILTFIKYFNEFIRTAALNRLHIVTDSTV